MASLARFLVRLVIVGLGLWALTLLPGIRLGPAPAGLQLVTLLLGAVVIAEANAMVRAVVRLGALDRNRGLAMAVLLLATLVVSGALFALFVAVSELAGLAYHVSGYAGYVWATLLLTVVVFVMHLVVPAQPAGRR